VPFSLVGVPRFSSGGAPCAGGGIQGGVGPALRSRGELAAPPPPRVPPPPPRRRQSRAGLLEGRACSGPRRRRAGSAARRSAACCAPTHLPGPGHLLALAPGRRGAMAGPAPGFELLQFPRRRRCAPRGAWCAASPRLPGPLPSHFSPTSAARPAPWPSGFRPAWWAAFSGLAWPGSLLPRPGLPACGPCGLPLAASSGTAGSPGRAGPPGRATVRCSAPQFADVLANSRWLPAWAAPGPDTPCRPAACPLPTPCRRADADTLLAARSVPQG